MVVVVVLVIVEEGESEKNAFVLKSRENVMARGRIGCHKVYGA